MENGWGAEAGKQRDKALISTKLGYMLRHKSSGVTEQTLSVAMGSKEAKAKAWEPLTLENCQHQERIRENS